MAGMAMTLTILRCRPGVTQDNLADFAAALNRSAREGKPMPLKGADGCYIRRAWVEGDALKVYAKENH